jgi:hypothetical protein
MARGRNWRHGWVPLTMRAAMSKAHGSRRGARKALGSVKAQARARKRVATSTRRARRAAGAVTGRLPLPRRGTLTGLV